MAASTEKKDATSASAHKAPTETRPGPSFDDIFAPTGRGGDNDEIELLDNYEYEGARRHGFINNLPSFIGKRRYTTAEDFEFGNLSVSLTNPQNTDTQNIIIDFVHHLFSEFGNIDAFLQISTPFKAITLDDSFNMATAASALGTSGFGRYLVTKDSIEPKITPSTRGAKNVVVGYSYGPTTSKELQRLAFKNSSIAVSKDIISRIYEPPKPKRFSNYFSVTDEPSEQLIIQRKIEGQAFNGSNFEQTIVESYTQSLVQDVESPPEGPTEVDIGSFTYSTPTTNTSTY